MGKRQRMHDLPELTEYERRVLIAMHKYTNSIRYIGVVGTIALILWVMERFS